MDALRGQRDGGDRLVLLLECGSEGREFGRLRDRLVETELQVRAEPGAVEGAGAECLGQAPVHPGERRAQGGGVVAEVTSRGGRVESGHVAVHRLGKQFHRQGQVLIVVMPPPVQGSDGTASRESAMALDVGVGPRRNAAKHFHHDRIAENDRGVRLLAAEPPRSEAFGRERAHHLEAVSAVRQGPKERQPAPVIVGGIHDVVLEAVDALLRQCRRFRGSGRDITQGNMEAQRLRAEAHIQKRGAHADVIPAARGDPPPGHAGIQEAGRLRAEPPGAGGVGQQVDHCVRSRMCAGWPGLSWTKLRSPQLKLAPVSSSWAYTGEPWLKPSAS